MAKQLVRLWERPSYDGRRFRYYLLYTDEQGKLSSRLGSNQGNMHLQVIIQDRRFVNHAKRLNIQ